TGGDCMFGFFFFFQAEDGIRDRTVTGVQTCALPILATIRDPALVAETVAQTLGAKVGLAEHIAEREMLLVLDNLEQVIDAAPERSEERRVGKEGRCGGGADE